MATFFVSCEITVGQYVFKRANEITVKSSWKELGDTCIIKMPLLKGKINKDRVNETLASYFKKGDAVSVTMAYTNAYTGKVYANKEFTGYLRRINPNVPLELECEDAVYLLRNTTLEKSWRNTTLLEVITYVVDEANKVNDKNNQLTISAKIPEVNLAKFSIDNANGAEVLEKIKEEYGLAAFFREKELFVGLAYTDNNVTVDYSFAWNILPNSDIKLRDKEDFEVRLKAIAILKDNKQLTVEVGDKKGSTQTQFYYGITDEATLKKVAEQDIKKLKFDGLEGSFSTLFLPIIQHSNIASLADPEMNTRVGNYLIDSVETKFTMKGITRKVVPGKRAS